MAIERPLSLKFIKDYFTNTYTTTNSDISFRAINLARGRTTPDSFVDFENNQVTRFNYISGADGGAYSGTGDLSSTFANYMTFQDSVAAGSEASSIWKLINTYQYGYSPLSTDYQVRIYVEHDYTVSGNFSGNIFLERSTSSSGPWTIKAVTFSTSGATVSFAFTPSTSDNDYFRIRLDNDYFFSSTAIMQMGIGIEVLDV